MFLRNMLQEISDSKIIFKIKTDNQAVIHICRNPVYKGRLRHIDVRYHFVRHLVEQRLAKLEHIPTAENEADSFTKALDLSKACQRSRCRGSVRNS
mmetsp:Transcript_34231/g.82854  ORF Transcript_34231/g.82854 Transcript_34231/m.82854 type:complete len:96 (-) Transcript_34231:9-296(-)